LKEAKQTERNITSNFKMAPLRSLHLFVAWLLLIALLGLIHPATSFITRASHARKVVSPANNHSLKVFQLLDRNVQSAQTVLELKSRPVTSLRSWKDLKMKGIRLLSLRLNTLEAVGLRTKRPKQKQSVLFASSLSSAALGLRGHSGLLLVSTVIVMLVKAFWKTVQQFRDIDSETIEEESAGVMDRCPWYV